MGLYYKSWWFVTFSIYYLVLYYMKSTLLKGINQFGTNLVLEYKKIKRIGYNLLFLNFVLIGIIILVLSQDKSNVYPNNLIYGVAFIDFYLMIVAVINICKYKNNKSPIIKSSKCISLFAAMISILSLKVAMINEFGENTTNFKLIIVSLTGFVITLINTIISVKMIIKANKVLENKK